MDWSSLPISDKTSLNFIFFFLTRLGHEAVLIFFVLSGFLVGGKALERILLGEFKPLGYSIDRAVRIMLPLFSGLFLFCIAESIVGRSIDWLSVGGSFLSLQGIICKPAYDVLWSLSYEVWFYILMCAFGYAINNRHGRKGLIGLLFLFLCCVVFVKLAAVYLAIWLMGAVAYFLLGRSSRWLLTLSFLSLLACTIGLQLTSGTHDAVGVETGSLTRNVLRLAFGLSACVFIVQLADRSPVTKIGVLINKYGTWLASFSYTLYLTHIPVQYIIVYFGAPKSSSISLGSMLLYFAWLVVAMFSAYGVYLLFESRTSDVKHILRHFSHTKGTMQKASPIGE